MPTHHAVRLLRFVSIAMLLVPVTIVAACRTTADETRAEATRADGAATNDTAAAHSGNALAPAQPSDRSTPAQKPVSHAPETKQEAAKLRETIETTRAQQDLEVKRVQQALDAKRDQVLLETTRAREALEKSTRPREELAAFEVLVPGTTLKLDMKPVPGGAIEVDDPARPGAKTKVDVTPLWFASSEITWDMYDSFVFAMDRAETETDPPDAWTRPSKPYILMDRGFGHAGFPAISVSYKGANEFCKWLSTKTGKRFRLPTEAEWEHAATAGIAGLATTVESLSERAWHAGNSELEMRLTTHPVKQKKADALGLFDMLGNASEWTTGPENKGVARGGSFKDAADQMSPRMRRPDDRSLNKTDPQVPKSVWWLADGGFIGFRVVCEPPTAR